MDRCLVFVGGGRLATAMTEEEVDEEGKETGGLHIHVAADEVLIEEGRLTEVDGLEEGLKVDG